MVIDRKAELIAINKKAHENALLTQNSAISEAFKSTP
jgi:hypothetical protein